MIAKSIAKPVRRVKGKKLGKTLPGVTKANKMKIGKKIADTASPNVAGKKKNVVTKAKKELGAKKGKVGSKLEKTSGQKKIGSELEKTLEQKIIGSKLKKRSRQKKISSKLEKKIAQQNIIKEEPINIKTKMIDQAIEGVRLLEKERRNKKGKDFLDSDNDESLIYLQLAITKVPNLLRRSKHIVRPLKMKVFLPNTIVNSNTDVLVIAKDDDEAKDIRDDHAENLHKYQEKLRVCGAARHISEVLTLRQLKVEFKEYEAKRNLANRTDVVLVDDTVLRRIPMFLGKHFYQKRKFPLPINLKSKNLLSEVERCLTIQILWFPNTGNCGLVKVGRQEQTNEMIIENIRAVISKVQKQIPGGWQNVQTMYLKTERSKAVPFYAKIRSVNDIEDIKPRPLNNRKKISGELTTAYGNLYTVFPDLTVKSKKRIEEEEDPKIDSAKSKKKSKGKEETKTKAQQNKPTKRKRKGKSQGESEKVTGSEESQVTEGEPSKKKKKGAEVSKVQAPKKTEIKEKDAEVSKVQAPKKKKKKNKGAEASKAQAPKETKNKILNDEVDDDAAPKKKKNKSKAKRKKSATELDLDSDEEKLEMIERDFLMRLDLEQVNEPAAGETTKIGQQNKEEEDDWAEGSGDDMSDEDF